MTRFLFVSFLLIPAFVRAQFSFTVEQDIPVADLNGNAYSFPWAGGLNATQFNTIDLDGDNDDDLALLDRMTNKIITFVNENSTWVYHPEFEKYFPEEVSNFMLLRDFNCDGKKDLFTYDLLGMRVYQNVTTGETLAWQHIRSFTGVESDIILTKGFSGMINIKTQFDDLPAITDADGDGDMDIFCVRFVGDGSIEYHKNYSMERYGVCDSLEFERVTQSWGDFHECGCGEFAFNGTNCPTNGRTKHAGGKSLLAFDANGDQQTDIVFSESTCQQLYLFINEGTTDEPVINSVTTFPDSSPVDFSIFPGAFYEDVNFDGAKDLIASPNIFQKEHDETNLKQSNWFYSNSGTTENPTFNFEQQDFLQNQMIDVGDNAVPAFADLEGDGDLDLFVSNNGTPEGPSTLSVFENVGSPTEPAYKLSAEHWAEFDATGLTNLKIYFADIDGNKTEDLVFTAADQSGFTKLYYYSNSSMDELQLSDSYQQITFHLTYTENISFADIDGDGLKDILVGRTNGTLEYWKNTGGSFTMANQNFIEPDNTIIRQSITAAAGDFNGDGRQDLILSDHSGQVTAISDFKTSNTEIKNVIYDPISQLYGSPNLGGQLWPTAVDLYNSGTPIIVTGNVLGGLSLLSTGEKTFTLLPNLLIKGESVKIQTAEELTLRIYSSTGSQIGGPVTITQGDADKEFPLYLSAGFYIFHFSGKKQSFSKKIVIR